MLRAVRFDNAESESKSVVIVPFQHAEDPAVEATLRALPHFHGTVDFSLTGYRLSWDGLLHRAVCIPSSYHTWRIGRTMYEEDVKALCVEMNALRKGQGLPAFKVVKEGKHLIDWSLACM